MTKIKIVNKKQEKVLKSLFDILGLDIQDLMNIKNFAEEIKSIKEENEYLKKVVNILMDKSKVYDENIQNIIKEVNDIKIGKYNEKIQQFFAERGLDVE